MKAFAKPAILKFNIGLIISLMFFFNLARASTISAYNCAELFIIKPDELLLATKHSRQNGLSYADTQILIAETFTRIELNPEPMRISMNHGDFMEYLDFNFRSSFVSKEKSSYGMVTATEITASKSAIKKTFESISKSYQIEVPVVGVTMSHSRHKFDFGFQLSLLRNSTPSLKPEFNKILAEAQHMIELAVQLKSPEFFLVVDRKRSERYLETLRIPLVDIQNPKAREYYKAIIKRFLLRQLSLPNRTWTDKIDAYLAQ